MVAVALLGGLIVGSFLNVVAGRLPLGQSLVRPRSRCPHCAAPVRARDNVPVLSWLLLRARCRDCGEPISWRYPAVELATGALFAAVVLALDDPVEIALGLIAVAALVPIVVIDLDHRLIPNAITLPTAIAAVVAIAVLDPELLPEHLIAGAAAGGFFLAAALAYPRGMGMGDVKLAAVLGLLLGRAVGPAILIALVAGVLVGAAVIARAGLREGRKTAVAFGPFLALGGMVSLFAGDALVDAYLDAF